MQVNKLACLGLAAIVALGALGCGSDKKADDKKAAGNKIVVVSREDGSGTRGAFIELFGIEQKKDGKKIDMTTESASITNSTAVMMTTVAGNKDNLSMCRSDHTDGRQRSNTYGMGSESKR